MLKIWLSLICRGRVSVWLRLCYAYGGFEEVFSVGFTKTQGFKRLSESIQHGLCHPDVKLLDNIQTWLEASTHHWCLFYDDPLYPEGLRALDRPPLCLFGRGNQNSLSMTQVMAVIGSRKASVQGLLSCDMIVTDLVAHGFVIASGLALGIDGAAHRAALKAGGVSLAVLGTSCEIIYPKEHQGLASQLIERQGALVSEYPVGTKPLPAHFPQRNRIVSALSMGVLVVEAAKRSGALITVNEGLKLGKDIFVMPSGIHNPQAKGGLWLIQQGAKCVVDVNDILDEYPGKTDPRQDADHNQPVLDDKRFSADDLQASFSLLASFFHGEWFSIEQLVGRVQGSISEVSLIVAKLLNSGHLEVVYDDHAVPRYRAKIE